MINQPSLFDKEIKEDKIISSLIKDLITAGRLHKYLDVNIYKYCKDTNQPDTAILKALLDVKRISMGVCIDLSKISLPRPLKIDILNKDFESYIEKSDISISPTKKDVLNIIRSLSYSYKSVVSRARGIRKMYQDSKQIIGIYKKENDLLEAIYKLETCEIKCNGIYHSIKDDIE